MVMSTTTSWRTDKGAMFSTLVTRVLLALGPVVMMTALWAWTATSRQAPGLAIPMAAAILVAWSPLFLSIPALLLQDARDAALDSWRGPLGSLARGVVLIPYLLLSPQSTIRRETAISLVGFAIAFGLAYQAFGI
jgi:hypothetical protein